MRKGILALPVTALLLAGCSKDKETLRVFTWADYVDPDLVERFENENGCRVKIDIFDSNEIMLAKLQAGANGYDVIFPSSYMVAKLARDGMLVDLRGEGVLGDPARLPNVKHIDPDYRKCALDPEMRFGVPYMVTYTGIAWRDDKEPLVSAPPEPSWSVFDRADLKGRTTLLDDMRETLGAALRLLGYSLNTRNPKELAAARDVVIRWKKNIAKFENEQYKSGVAGGEFHLVHGYSGDIGQTQLDEDGALAPDLNHVRFFLPKEGFSLSCDEMAVPVTAPNKELAYKFINFLHDPEVAAQNMEYTAYWCPNAGAKAILAETNPEMAANPMVFPDPADLVRGEVIADLGDDLALYTRVWVEIKASENK